MQEEFKYYSSVFRNMAFKIVYLFKTLVPKTLAYIRYTMDTWDMFCTAHLTTRCLYKTGEPNRAIEFRPETVAVYVKRTSTFPCKTCFTSSIGTSRR